jgi:hypothetical protein
MCKKQECRPVRGGTHWVVLKYKIVMENRISLKFNYIFMGISHPKENTGFWLYAGRAAFMNVSPSSRNKNFVCVCVCVCVFVHTHIYVYIYMCVYIYTYICVYIYIKREGGVAYSAEKLATGPTVRVSNPGVGEIFRTHPDGSETHPTSCTRGTRTRSPG